MPSIELHNAQRKVKLDLSPLRQFATRALECCLQETPPDRSDLVRLDVVTIVFVSDRRMAQLHEEFMQIPGPTDVLTFQDGDIFVSIETAQSQAAQFGTSTEAELKLYLVHGLLHLHGFDDKTAATARKMATRQSRIVAAAERMV